MCSAVVRGSGQKVMVADDHVLVRKDCILFFFRNSLLTKTIWWLTLGRNMHCYLSKRLIKFFPAEHVLTCTRVPDHHLLLRGFRLSDDAPLPGCHPRLRQHLALHPEDQEHVPEIDIQIRDGQHTCLYLVEYLMCIFKVIEEQSRIGFTFRFGFLNSWKLCY